MPESMWDAALKGFSFGEQASDRWSRASAARKAKKLEASLIDEKDPFKRQELLDAGLAEIEANAAKRSVDVSDLRERLDSRFARQEGREAGRTEYEGSRPEETPIVGPSPIAGTQPTGAPMMGGEAAAASPDTSAIPIGGGGGGGGGGGDVPRPIARTAGTGFGDAADMTARSLYARGKNEEARQFSDRAANAQQGQAALAAPRLATGDIDMRNVYSAQQERALQQGNPAAAEAAGQEQTRFRTGKAVTLAGMIARGVEMKNITPDQMRAYSTELFKMVPETGMSHMQAMDNGNYALFDTQGKAVHEVNSDNAGEIVGMINEFSKTPDKFLQDTIANRTAEITAQKATDAYGKKQGFDTILEIIKKSADNSPKFTDSLDALFKSGGGGEGGGKGFNLQEVAPGEIKFTVGSNGQPVSVMLTDKDTKAADGETPLGPNKLIFRDADGNKIDPPVEFGGKGQMVALREMLSASMEDQVRISQQVTNNAIRMASAAADEYRGVSRPAEAGEDTEVPRAREGDIGRKKAPADKKRVNAEYDEVEAAYGFTPSSKARTPEENRKAGGVKGSQHLVGTETARDWDITGKKPAERKAFIAALQDRGYEAFEHKVEGGKLHIHAEVPKGGLPAGEEVAEEAPAAPAVGAADTAPATATAAGTTPAATAEAPAEAGTGTPAPQTKPEGPITREALVGQAKTVRAQSAAADKAAGDLESFRTRYANDGERSWAQRKLDIYPRSAFKTEAQYIRHQELEAKAEEAREAVGSAVQGTRKLTNQSKAEQRQSAQNEELQALRNERTPTPTEYALPEGSAGVIRRLTEKRAFE